MQPLVPDVTESIVTNIELLVKEYRTNLVRFDSEHPELHTDIEQLAQAYRAELFRNATLPHVAAS